MSEIIKYSPVISDFSPVITLKESEYIKSIIDDFLNFLDKNNIKHEHLIYVINNDIVTQQIIYILYDLITLNFSALKITEVTTILPKNMKGGTIQQMLTFLMILLLLSNIFTGVDSLLKQSIFKQSIKSELSSKIYLSRSQSYLTRTPSTTLTTITLKDIFEQLTEKLNKIIKIIKKNGRFTTGSSFIKLFLFKDIKFGNIKSFLFGSAQLSSSYILVEQKQLLDKINLMIKITDAVINTVTLSMSIYSSGGLSINHASSFVKTSISITQIIQTLFKKEDEKLKEMFDIVGNLFFIQDIGKLINEISMMYIGYIGLSIFTETLLGKGRKSHKKRKTKKRKTKKRYNI